MKRIVILLLAGAVCACARSSKSGETTTPQVRVDNDIIAVAPGSPVLERLTTGKVTATPYRATFTTSGMVQAIPARYAEIATPFAGRIVKSFVRLGQKVVQGSPIFEISSPSFFDTGKAYYQAKQEMELALKSLNREKDLLKNHVGVEKEVEEAEVNYELKKKDYENAVAALKVYQIDPGTMVLGQPLVVRSPIAGEVVKDNIVLGQYIKEDAGPLALVVRCARRDRNLLLADRHGGDGAGNVASAGPAAVAGGDGTAPGVLSLGRRGCGCGTAASADAVLPDHRRNAVHSAGADGGLHPGALRAVDGFPRA